MRASCSARTWLLLSTCTLLAVLALPVRSEVRIAVLDFELKDLTPMPRTPEELQRTASVAPLLRSALAQKHGYRLIAIDPKTQLQSDAGFGYLFDHPEAAAALGAGANADWVAVGRVHKPSFLFAYLKVRLIDVQSQRLAGDYVVEVKGPQEPATRRGVALLAEQIENTLSSAETNGRKPSRADAPRNGDTTGLPNSSDPASAPGR